MAPPYSVMENHNIKLSSVVADHNNGKNHTVLVFWVTNRNCWVTDKTECR